MAQGSHAEIAQPGSAVTWIFPIPSGMGEKKPVFSPRVSGRVKGGRGCSHGRVRVERGKQASWRGSRAPTSHGLHGGKLVQDEDYTAVSITDSMTTNREDTACGWCWPHPQERQEGAMTPFLKSTQAGLLDPACFPNVSRAGSGCQVVHQGMICSRLMRL